MRTKTKISLRIDDDLLKVLKDNSTNNFTAYVESLIIKGLVTDFAEISEQIKASRNLINNSENESKVEVNTLSKEFESDMRTATIFLQEMVFKIALKQGFNENDLKKLYSAIQKKFEQ